MAVNKKNIMTRYFFVVLVMGLIGVAIIVKGTVIMFAERQYWQDVADRFVKENVTVKPNRGNILSSDGKLMASSLPCLLYTSPSPRDRQKSRMPSSA